MTIISASVICDSITMTGDRITTLELVYPRLIHSEFMTHRVFSRNAGSSRAIPTAKAIRAIKENPAEPIYWGKNKKGMQASSELQGFKLFLAKFVWRYHRVISIRCASLMSKLGAHKQIVNRLIEPHSHIKLVVTSTDWANFMALRDHPAAQPEIRATAREIGRKMAYSMPTLLNQGEWHLPYITAEDMVDIEGKTRSLGELQSMSVARCARTSYQTFGGSTSTLEEDLELYKKLLGSHPIHASPAEHQACADPKHSQSDLWGNFYGWIQYRKLLPNECVKDTRRPLEATGVEAALHGSESKVKKWKR